MSNKLYCVQVLSLLLMLLDMLISGSLAMPPGGKFEKFAESYKPIRETVCAGKATKAQLTAMVQCMELFKASFKDITAKTAEVKGIVQDCLAEGDKDITFEVDKSHLELIYLMCSKKFGQCLHRQLPKFRLPRPADGAGSGSGTDTSKGAGPLSGPDGDQKVEQFIACEKKALNL